MTDDKYEAFLREKPARSLLGSALLWLTQTTRFANPGNQGDLFTTRQPLNPTQASCPDQVAAGRTGTVLGEGWLNEAEITGLSAIEDADLLRLCI